MGIKIKGSKTAGSKPTALSIGERELAVNLVDKKIFTKDHLGNIIEVGGSSAGNVDQTLSFNETTNILTISGSGSTADLSSLKEVPIVFKGLTTPLDSFGLDGDTYIQYNIPETGLYDGNIDVTEQYDGNILDLDANILNNIESITYTRNNGIWVENLTKTVTDNKYYLQFNGNWTELPAYPTVISPSGFENSHGNGSLTIVGRIDSNYLTPGKDSLDASFSKSLDNGGGVSGSYSTSLGRSTLSYGYASTAMGYFTKAIGNYSTAIGDSTTASGNSSTAMGYSTTASGSSSASLGSYTTASGSDSTSIGDSTTASGPMSFAQGQSTQATSKGDSAFGKFTVASNGYSTVIGQYNGLGSVTQTVGTIFEVGIGTKVDARANALEVYTDGRIHAPGLDISDIINAKSLITKEYLETQGGSSTGFENSHGNGSLTKVGRTEASYLAPGSNAVDASYSQGAGEGTRVSGASGNYSFTTGLHTIASSDRSIAMGHYSTASGINSVAIGNKPTASSQDSIAIGNLCSSTNSGAVSIGTSNQASGINSLALGSSTVASAKNSTAMGGVTTASGNYSTAMGYATTASGYYSTAMGYSTTASGYYSTSMGDSTTASGNFSVSIGKQNQSIGQGSFSSGNESVANSEYSTAIGYGSVTDNPYQTVIGRHNGLGSVTQTVGTIFEVGIGANTTTRANALEVYTDGRVHAPGLKLTKIIDDKSLITKEHYDFNKFDANFTSTDAQTAFIVSTKVFTSCVVTDNGIGIRDTEYSITDDGVNTTVTFTVGRTLNNWIRIKSI